MPQAQGWTLEHARYPYLTESVVTRFMFSTGISDVPISYEQAWSSEQTCEPVGLNRPQARKVVEFEFVRQGAAPRIPTYLTGDPNEVLLTVEVSFEDPKIGPDGVNYIYHTTGRYLYMLKQPLAQVADKWPIGPVDAGQQQNIEFTTG